MISASIFGKLQFPCRAMEALPISAKQQQGNVPDIQTDHVIFSTEKSSGPSTWLTDQTVRPSAAPFHKFFFFFLCDA